MKRSLILCFTLFFACGDVTEPNLPERPHDDVIVYVCHNPNSIWHLSECHDGGEACLSRNYDQDAYCLALRERTCQVPRDMQSDFVRRACGYYYTNM